MIAHTRKQQGQYKKIIKEDDQIKSETLDPPSVPSTLIPSIPSSSSTSISSSSTSSSSVIPMSKDQFKKFMSKLCDNMYDNLYELYYNIKSESVVKSPKSKSSDKVIASSTTRIKYKNIKKTQTEEARTLSDDEEDEDE